MPESNLRKLLPLSSDRDYMHGQYSKEIQHLFLNSLWNEDMLLNENHVIAKVYPSYKNMTVVQGLSSREHCKLMYKYITQMKLIIMSGGKTENWVGIINPTYRFFSSSPYSGWCVLFQEMDIESLQFFKLLPFFVLHKIVQQVQGWNETWEKKNSCAI